MTEAAKRVLSLFLCLVLCLGLAPVSALAAEEAEAIVDLEEEAPAEPILLTGEDPEEAVEVLSAVPEEDPSGEPEVLLYAETEPAVYAPGGDDSAELLDGFARSRLDALRPAGAGLQNVRNLGGEFSGMMAAVYKYIRAESKKVADGQRTSTVFEMAVNQLGLSKTSWTKEDLGTEIVVDGAISQAAMQAARATMNFDLGLQIDVLLADGPYDFYWYDKTVGTRMRGPSYTASYSSGEWVLSLTGSVTFSFTVGQEFAADTYETTGKVGTAVTNAVKNAAKIVAENAGLTDVDKLIAYRTAICNMVEYNHAAVETDTAYGNPWQLIWVFDGDSSTNVVCEGYSKAFQYLCDLTKFSRAVTAYSVTGYMDGGAHMWNMVSMPNGKNYLVDVTNCDSGTIGAPDKLFLAGGSGSASRGYTVYGIYYQYSSDTLAMFSDKDRTLSGYYYKDDPTRPTAPAEVSTVTVTGVSLTLKGQVGIYVYVKMPSGAQTARLTYPKTGEVKNYFLDMDPSCYVADSNQYKFLYPNVPAKELTQPLALEVFDANGNAMAITHTSLGSQGKKFTCKAVDYCNTILASPTQSDALKDLVKAILNYGQCAQIQFDFDTGNPANPKGYLAEEMKTVTPVSANDPVIPSNAADVGWEYGTLSLKGAVSANLYFSKAITAKNENGKAYKVTARSGGKWSITVDNIPAKNLGDKFTVVASYGGKSATIKYSALSYTNAVLRSDTQPDTLKELCKAIILYNKYAKAYFGN